MSIDAVDAFVALGADDATSEAPFSYGEWMAKLGAPSQPFSQRAGGE